MLSEEVGSCDGNMCIENLITETEVPETYNGI